MSERVLTVSSSPHVRSKQSTMSLMRDVLIALAPASVLSIVFFGWKSLLLIALCIGASVATEAGMQKFMKKEITVGDLSAAVTGLLLALNLPINAPWWLAVIGSVFAIAVVKQLFGGLGCNFVNPALAARVFLVASWPTFMSGGAYIPDAVSSATDAISSATPLAIWSGEAAGQLPSILQMFLGNGVYGCIGEVSALALILGGAYLIVRKVISYVIPCSYIGTVAVFALIAGYGFDGMLFQIFAGGLMIGAIFMATDYVTSPITPLGQMIYGIGCGLMTCIIRFYGGYSEGVMFSILFMNAVAPLIDKYFRAKKYGEVKKNA